MIIVFKYFKILYIDTHHALFLHHPKITRYLSHQCLGRYLPVIIISIIKCMTVSSIKIT